MEEEREEVGEEGKTLQMSDVPVFHGHLPHSSPLTPWPSHSPPSLFRAASDSHQASRQQKRALEFLDNIDNSDIGIYHLDRDTSGEGGSTRLCMIIEDQKNGLISPFATPRNHQTPLMDGFLQDLTCFSTQFTQMFESTQGVLPRNLKSGRSATNSAQSPDTQL